MKTIGVPEIFMTMLGQSSEGFEPHGIYLVGKKERGYLVVMLHDAVTDQRYMGFWLATDETVDFYTSEELEAIDLKVHADSLMVAAGMTPFGEDEMVDTSLPV